MWHAEKEKNVCVFFKKAKQICGWWIISLIICIKQLIDNILNMIAYEILKILNILKFLKHPFDINN